MTPEIERVLKEIDEARLLFQCKASANAHTKNVDAIRHELEVLEKRAWLMEGRVFSTSTQRSRKPEQPWCVRPYHKDGCIGCPIDGKGVIDCIHKHYRTLAEKEIGK